MLNFLHNILEKRWGAPFGLFKMWARDSKSPYSPGCFFMVTKWGRDEQWLVYFWREPLPLAWKGGCVARKKTVLLIQLEFKPFPRLVEWQLVIFRFRKGFVFLCTRMLCAFQTNGSLKWWNLYKVVMCQMSSSQKCWNEAREYSNLK
jgi:hypothetical protein